MENNVSPEVKSFIGFLFIMITIFGPMITIWSINKLFETEIPINLGTWFATFWITFILTSAASAVFMNNMNNIDKGE